MDRPKRLTKPPPAYMRNEDLIEAVRDRPPLWDDGCPGHKDRALKKALWQEIAKKFVGGSPIDCKKTWEKLRRALSNHRLNYFKKYGVSGSEGKNYLPYRYEHLMTFLDACKEKDNMNGNLSAGKNNDDDEQSDGDSDNSDDVDDVNGGDSHEEEEEDNGEDQMADVCMNDESECVFDMTLRTDQSLLSEPESGFKQITWTLQKDNMKPLGDVSNSSIYTKPTIRKLFSPKVVKFEITGKENSINNNPSTPPKPVPKKRSTASHLTFSSKKPKAFKATPNTKKAKKVNKEALKVRKQQLLDAKREDIVKKLEEEVRKEEAALKVESSEKINFLSPLEEAVMRELEKKDDEVTLFLSSLQDPVRALSKPVFRKFQCQVLQLVGKLEEQQEVKQEKSKFQPSPLDEQQEVKQEKSKFQPSPLMLTEVKAALTRNEDEQCVVVGDQYALYGRDMRTLVGEQWLNDQIMNAYFNLVAAKGNGKHMDSYFFQSLFKKNYSPAQWDSSDLMKYPYMVVPTFREESLHWSMMFACPQTKRLSYLDSMGGRYEEGLETLKKFLEEETQVDWEIQDNENHPRQMNSYDCGVFACMFANFLAAGNLHSTSFTQVDIPHIRKRMLYELCHAKLLPLP